MILQRLRLAGFLALRDPQELDFRSARLWLLSGPNGSGKSVIFDAISWCLFNFHRGGQVPSPHLIHADCSQATVELEFAADGQVFRAAQELRRSRKRPGVSLRQRELLQLADGHWQPLPHTRQRQGFDHWIAAHVCPSPAVFAATKVVPASQLPRLAEATPKARAELLADIIGLPQVQRLHQQARQEMLAAQAAVAATAAAAATTTTTATTATAGGAIHSATDISEADIHAAQTAAATADEAARQALALVQTAESSLAAAWEQQSLRSMLQAAQERHRQATDLLQRAAAIEQDHAHWQTLGAVLPVAERVLAARARREESHQRTVRFEKQRDALQTAREHIEEELATQKNRVQELEAERAAAEHCYQEATRSLQQSAERRELLRRLRKLQTERERLSEALCKFPVDLHEQAAAAQAEANRLKRLAVQLPLLDRLRREQREIAELGQQIVRLEEDCEALRAQGEATRIRHDAAATALERLEADFQLLQKQAAACEAEARLRQSAVEELRRMEGAAVCTLCGQALPQQHWEAEQARRRAAAQQAQDALRRAADQAEACRTELDQQRQLLQPISDQLARLRQEYRQRRQAADEAARQHARLEVSAQQLREAVDAEFRNQPFTELQAEVLNRPRVEQMAHLLSNQLSHRYALEQQATRADADIQAELQRLAPATPEEVQAELDGSEATLQTLTKHLETLRQQITAAREDVEQLARRRHELLEELANLTGCFRMEEEIRQNCDAVIDHELQQLPADWQLRVDGASLTDLAGWSQAFEALQTRRIAEQYAELTVARTLQQHSELEIAALEARLQALGDTLDVEAVEQELARLRDRQRLAEAHAANCRAALANLLEEHARQQQRGELANQAIRTLRDWQRLDDLLGRVGLQRQLMQQAEQNVLQLANELLQTWQGEAIRLSLGTQAEADRALDLLAQPAGVTQPLPPAFLSTGQRVGVGLALTRALGRLHTADCRTALLLDDPFIGLDLPARSWLIQTLRALSRQLGCVIVSSHLSELEPEFDAVYGFERSNGTSRIFRKR